MSHERETQIALEEAKNFDLFQRKMLYSIENTKNSSYTYNHSQELKFVAYPSDSAFPDEESEKACILIDMRDPSKKEALQICDNNMFMRFNSFEDMARAMYAIEKASSIQVQF